MLVPPPRILGIDLGSTSTRASLLCLTTGTVYHIHNKRSRPWSRCQPGDFFCILHPYDEGPVYVAEGPDPAREGVPAKYAMYPLAGAEDELLGQYPLVTRPMERRHDSHFLARLRRGLTDLFTVVRRQVVEVACKHRLTVDKIGLSVPSQWTIEFQDVYRSIVSGVFRHPENDIYFHPETVALAHYLFRDHPEELGLVGGTFEEVKNFLFIDFGGHNVVSRPVFGYAL